MDICLTGERSTGITLVPIVMVIGQVVLKRCVGGTNKVGLVVALIVAVGVGEVVTALKVAGTVTAVLIALCGRGDAGSYEGAMMYPTTLNGRSEGRALLLTFHTYTVLRNVLKGYISNLKALTATCIIVCGLTDKVQTPAVNGSIRADTLDGDILTARHTRHKAVVTGTSAVVNAVILGKAVDLGNSIAHVAAARTLNATDNTDYEGSAFVCQLTENILVGVSLTALGVKAGANVHTCRAENVTDTCNGGAVLCGNGDAILVLVGNVKNDCVLLQCTVVVIRADTVGVVEVGITRAVVLKHLNTAGGNTTAGGSYSQRVCTCLKAGDVDTDDPILLSDKVFKVVSRQAARHRAAVGYACDVSVVHAADRCRNGFKPSCRHKVTGRTGTCGKHGKC